MSNLHLEAIKARAEAATRMTGGLPWEVVNDVMVSAIERNPRDGSVESGGNVACPHNSNLSAHIAGMDPETTLALIEEVERLRERQTITNDMIERAALAIAEVDEWPTNEELGGKWFDGTRDDEFRDEFIDMARAALEAALKEDQ